ncbi:MAG: hypothetical protein E2O74_03720 [Chloroflexi bacterium]|nr:hypothetical protein [Chloroflexota bacterium]MCH8338541.1 hypothetical protein [Chloroflexota bacterium]TDI85260.1 MAG: hypothetical protein E2O74_03720 [Chloroflexota bacterium]
MSNQVQIYNADTGTSYAGLLLWLEWVLASVAGFAIGGVVGSQVSHPAGMIVTGALVGMLQWVILRQYIARAGWVALAGLSTLIICFAFGGAIVGAVSGLFGGASGLIAGGAVAGLVMGATGGSFQARFLGQHLSRASWWIIASALGWSVGEAASMALGQGGGSLVGGAIAGAITGTALVWLMGHSPRVRKDVYYV